MSKAEDFENSFRDPHRPRLREGVTFEDVFTGAGMHEVSIDDVAVPIRAAIGDRQNRSYGLQNQGTRFFASPDGNTVYAANLFVLPGSGDRRPVMNWAEFKLDGGAVTVSDKNHDSTVSECISELGARIRRTYDTTGTQ